MPLAREKLDYRVDDYQGPLDPDKMSPHARRDWYTSERQRVALEVEQGELVSREVYREAIAEVFKMIAMRLDQLPADLVDKYRIDPDTSDRVQDMLDELRLDIVDALQNAGTEN